MNEPIAIVGMACRLPGADGLEAFWKLVVERGAAWGPLPESRLPRDLYFHPEKSRVGKSYSELGAVVPDRPVDPAVCPITADHAARYDIAHRIFLEVASLACRDAGMDPFAMPTDRTTGVYVGHTGGSTQIGDLVYSTGIDEAASLLAETPVARELLGGSVGDVVADVVEAVRRRYPGRQPGEKLDLGALGAAQIVHEALHLSGPFLVVDAACASSLQAMAIGARALLQGGIDQAIVGGASYCKSDSLVLFSAAQSVSNRGSCPFGESADGLITAEGYVALVIKKLSRAIADGDRIRAVIRGLGVASDGKGKSLWAPRQEGQVLAVERAYPDPADLGRIEYIEAHATSTQVGDATELSALARFLKPHVSTGRQIPIGSVKANIGHTLETAGIASLVKVVLAMEHGVIPPGSTCEELNSEFDWHNGPFTVPRAPLVWPAHADGSPRHAAVNAFGIGGLNVHVALSEYLPSAAARPIVTHTTDDECLAIVGAGCVLPGALALDAFFSRIDRGESAIGPVPTDRWQATRAIDRTGPRTWHTMSDRGGFVRDFAYDWRRHKVPPKQIAAANPLQFMLLEAADAAIADAGGPQAGLDRARTGVVVGTLFGGDFANQLQLGLRLPETGRDLRGVLARRGVSPADIDRIVEAYEQTLLERMPALVDETGSFTSSTLASRLTKTFDLMGGALALDAGDCSSVSALSAAADMLRQGDCDAVICAAGQRSLDLMAFEGLSLAGKLGETADGVVPGEGAVVFVLKRLQDARAAGNRIRGIIRNAAVRSARPAPQDAVPSLAGLFGHTGAVAAAAELLSLTKARAEGTVSISHGTLVGRIEVGESTERSTVSPASRLVTAAAGRPLVAAIFPGQGSQYTDMFRGLVAESPEARESLARLDAVARAVGHQTLAEIAWRSDNGLGTRIWDTQWSMYLGDLLAWDVLRGMGFAPDVVASHSFGEFPALAATAAWTIEDGARATRARADAVEQHGPRDGAMLSVIADRATVHAAISSFAGHVWVCAENAPEQFVVGGTARVVDAVEVLIETQGVKSKRLAVPSPFHTPLLARSAEHLAAAIDAIPITVPATPIFSSTAVSQMADPSAVRASLIRQMTETVRWISVVEKLYAAGVRTFVEVGPSGVLTGLSRRILEGREGCTFLQFDHRSRAAGDHLARLREQLAMAGAIRTESPVKKRPQSSRGTVVAFDATARRRERNRAGTSPRVAPREPAPIAVRVSRQPIAAAVAGAGHSGLSHMHGNGRDHEEGNGEWQRGTTAMLVAERPAVATPRAPRTPVPDASPHAGHASGNEIEAFLIDFVVEQTGYPREIVELDADLEGDLGIDSIRKAQLFGEIGQKYAIKADDSVSLAEFPTLRHLLDYMLPRVGATAAVSASSSPAASAPATLQPVREEPASVDLAAALGGFDALLVGSTDAAAPRGVIACFGRHASPAVRRVEAGGLRATLIGAEGLPGALVGWNDAGLIACAVGMHGRDSLAATAAVEDILTSCRSAADAEEVIGRLSLARCLVVAHIAGGANPVSTACDPKSVLHRVALADGTIDTQQALAALLSRHPSAARDALSATCGWFACGVLETGPNAVSGGPFAGEWLGSDAAIRGGAWSPTSASDITRRYSIALHDIGSTRTARNLAGERVMILASDGLADSLASAVEAQGAVAVLVQAGSLDEALQLIERAENDGAVRHLIVAARPQASSAGWTGRRNEAIDTPFFACQRWITMRGKAGDMPSSTLTAVIDLGGDFGISGAIGAVEGGGLAGLFKGIAREFPALHVRVVDAPNSLALRELAAAVVDEMQDAAGPVEVGLVNGRRVTVVPTEHRPRSGQPLASLAQRSVWIVTGGARGVTAECALALGRRHGLVLALVGSTHPVAVDASWLGLDDAGLKELKGRVMLEARGRGGDPRSAWRSVEKSIEIEKSLARFRGAGVDARYFACDLADEAAVQSLVQRVVREMGPVRGVLHGAGFESACRFEKKTLEGLLATLGPKCAGIEHLLAAVDPAALEAVVGFGSTSGRLGGHGQADYSLANDMLAKILGARRKRGLRATVFHWHAWDEVGMASRPESRFVLEQFGLKFMPLVEGVGRFMDELEAGLPEGEVLVTEPACVPDSVAAADASSAGPATGTHGSLVHEVTRGASSTAITFRLDPTTDRFLLDHLQFGRPLLPAVMGAELLAQAAIASGACGVVQEIREFTVERPIAFSTNQPRQVRVEIATGGRGAVQAVGWVDAEQRSAIRGIVSTESAAPIVVKTSEPPLPFNPMVYADDAPLRHGASFRTLTGLFLDRSGGWGRLVAPAADVVAAPRGSAGWTVPAALLDGCIVACAVYSYILCGLRVEVPVKFERLRITGRPRSGETCIARLLFRSNDVRESVYDLVLFGDDGRALLALDGLHLAIMGNEKARG
ncbi:MAG: beta-ketoacyl synthase N-terminal-like domain-containing protein [Pirellulales bacterium]